LEVSMSANKKKAPRVKGAADGETTATGMACPHCGKAVYFSGGVTKATCPSCKKQVDVPKGM
jgi:ribosomal protein S27E